jgi:hypothetical protein
MRLLELFLAALLVKIEKNETIQRLKIKNKGSVGFETIFAAL